MGIEEKSDQYKEIKEARTWETLYAVLDKFETIRGTEYFYLPRELKSLMDSIRNGVLANLARLPKTGGVRDKARELVNQERLKKGLKPI